MALNYADGSFTSPTVNGTQAISGLGFQPKYVRIIGIDTSNSIVDDYVICVGHASGSGSTEQWGISALSDDNQSVQSVTYRAIGTGVIVNLAANSSTFTCVAELQSFDSDGFKLNWTTTSTAVSFVFMAMAGSSLNIDVGTVTFPNTIGNFSKTGLSFQPKALEVATIFRNLSSPISSDCIPAFGAAISSTERFSIQTRSQNGLATSDTWRYQSAIRLLKRSVDSIGTIDIEVDFVIFNSDGFTLDNINPPGGAQDLPYVAWGGDINVKIGSFTQPSDGSQNITGLGFKPFLNFFYGIQNPTIESVVSSNAIQLGVGSDLGEIYARAFDTDNTVTTNSKKRGGSSFCFETGGGTTTTNGEASFTANTSDGFDLLWANSDASARNINFLSIGDAATGVTILRRRREGY